MKKTTLLPLLLLAGAGSLLALDLGNTNHVFGTVYGTNFSGSAATAMTAANFTGQVALGQLPSSVVTSNYSSKVDLENTNNYFQGIGTFGPLNNPVTIWPDGGFSVGGLNGDPFFNYDASAHTLDISGANFQGNLIGAATSAGVVTGLQSNTIANSLTNGQVNAGISLAVPGGGSSTTPLYVGGPNAGSPNTNYVDVYNDIARMHGLKGFQINAGGKIIIDGDHTFSGTYLPIFAQNVIPLSSPDAYLQNDVWFYNLVSSYQPNVGGSASAMSDLPPDRTVVGSLLPNRPFIWTTYPGFTTGTNAQGSESEITNMMNNWTTNGLLAALTNNNLVPFVWFDPTSWNLTNGRPLGIDTRYYPSGTNLFRTIHSWGFKAAQQMYFDTSPTNKYLDGFGNVTNANGLHYTPITTMNQVASDAFTFRLWGCDMEIAADMGSDSLFAPKQTQVARKAINASLYPPDVVGLPATTYQNLWSPALAGSTQPMSIGFYYPTTCQGAPEIASDVNMLMHDGNVEGGGVNYPGSNTLSWLRWDWTNEVPLLSPGHWGVPQWLHTGSTTNQNMQSLAASIAGNTPIGLACDFTNISSTYLPILTDPVFLQAASDNSQIPSAKLRDDGTGAISAWLNQQQNGRLCVSVFNENSYATNISCDFSNFARGQSWTANAAWGYGTLLSGTTLTVSNVASSGADIVELSPSSTSDASTAAGGNIVFTNYAANNSEIINGTRLTAINFVNDDIYFRCNRVHGNSGARLSGVLFNLGLHGGIQVGNSSSIENSTAFSSILSSSLGNWTVATNLTALGSIAATSFQGSIGTTNLVGTIQAAQVGGGTNGNYGGVSLTNGNVYANSLTLTGAVFNVPGSMTVVSNLSTG
ncbi:MAG: hypothetical protein KGL39_57875, partial [Patescibacteria group bacterium]|nr:hypothetical protein [Patescibacteria group bacterium]